MQPTIYRPSIQLQYKFYALTLLVGLMTLVGPIILVALITLDEPNTPSALLYTLTIVANVVWIGVAMVAIPLYFRSLRYEVQDDEVIVYVGIVTKSVKHVPYRTVTNLKVMQGPLDRLFGIGTLTVQTAGMSGQTGAEESLIGLPNFREVYEQVAATLRRYRGAMSPTQGSDEELPVSSADPTFAALLEEVRAIRRAVEQQS